MSQTFQSGDFLVFQVESGFALLRVLAIDEMPSGSIWHLAAYRDFYLDVDTADTALESPESLILSHDHIALTQRAFESTQVARMTNVDLTDAELRALTNWRNEEKPEVSDRSIRLMLGLR